MVDTNNRPLRVCVVGAGPTGIITTKVMALEYNIHVTCYESKSKVGGVWRFDSQHKQPDEPMYCDLSTNIPHQQMQYTDMPMKSEFSYPTQACVQQYLEDYAAHHQLYQYIQFNTVVIYVNRDTDTKRYSVTTFNKATQQKHTEQFDAVVVANGHFAIPSYPDFVDKSQIDHGKHSGDSMRILHSMHYYNAAEFAGQRVLVIGASHSGVDIANQIAATATSVSVSMKSDTAYKMTYNVISNIIAAKEHVHNNLDKLRVVDTVKHVDVNSKTVTFTDGSTGEFDTIVTATGYVYSFDFLNIAIRPTVAENRIQQLYMHLFDSNTPDGTLTFPGIPWRIVPFPMAEVQAQCIASVITHKLKLPNSDEMRHWCDKLYKYLQQNDIPVRYTHKVNHNLYVQSLIDFYNQNSQRQYDYTVYDNRKIRRVKR